MPRKTFRCPKCGRTFSMAGHLGRHMSAIHGRSMSGGAKRGPKPGARKGKRGAAKGKAAGKTVSDSWAHLVAKVGEYGQELEAQFSALGKRVQAARHAFEMLRGHAANGRRKRRRRRSK